MDQENAGNLPAGPTGADASYAGKWVAAIHGRVVAVGETPEQARLLALRNWPKDEAIVLRIPPGGLRTSSQEPT